MGTDHLAVPPSPSRRPTRWRSRPARGPGLSRNATECPFGNTATLNSCATPWPAAREALRMPGQTVDHRPQMERGLADRAGQRLAVQIETGVGIDLRLPVQRTMIGILRDQDVGDRALGRLRALDQAGRRRRLDNALLAGPTVLDSTGLLSPTPSDRRRSVDERQRPRGRRRSTALMPHPAAPARPNRTGHPVHGASPQNPGTRAHALQARRRNVRTPLP